MDQDGGIRIIPIGALDTAVLAPLCRPLGARFGRSVRIEPAVPHAREWYDHGRDQYRADRILDDLSGHAANGPNAWLLAVIDADLYAPGLRFIFGQATVGGCCAVIGLARLRPGVGADAAGRDRFRRRVLTEAVHELGHVAGLGHCPQPLCAMYFSNTLAETDRKGPDFCGRCRSGAAGRAA